MNGFEGAPSWSDLSDEERERLVKEVAARIAADTGYLSKGEKRTQRQANGTLSGSDSRKPEKSKGNRPGTTRTKIKRGGSSDTKI